MQLLVLRAQDDGLVDEHVVVVLVVGHEVVADRQEGVADRQESFEDGLVDGGQEVDVASCRRKFSKSASCGRWTLWTLVAVGAVKAGRCELLVGGSSEKGSEFLFLLLCVMSLLCGEHARRSSPLTLDS